MREGILIPHALMGEIRQQTEAGKAALQLGLFAAFLAPETMEHEDGKLLIYSAGTQLAEQEIAQAKIVGAVPVTITRNALRYEGERPVKYTKVEEIAVWNSVAQTDSAEFEGAINATQNVKTIGDRIYWLAPAIVNNAKITFSRETPKSETPLPQT